MGAPRLGTRRIADRSRRRALAALLATTTAIAGCATPRVVRHRLDAAAFARLDGSRADQGVVVEFADGQKVPYTEDSTFDFAAPGVARHRIRCAGVKLEGPLLACLGEYGVRERVELARWPEAYLETELPPPASHNDASGTAIVVVVLVIAGVVALGVYCNDSPCLPGMGQD